MANVRHNVVVEGLGGIGEENVVGMSTCCDRRSVYGQYHPPLPPLHPPLPQ